MTKWILCLHLFLLISGSSLQATEHLVYVDINMGFGMQQATPGFIPVWIHIENKGMAVTGEIVITTTHRELLQARQRSEEYRIPVSLPSNSDRVYQGVVMYSGSPYQIRIETDEGDIIYNQPYELQVVNPVNHQVLVVSDNQGGYDFLRNAEMNRVSVFYLQPQFLPMDWLGYQTVDTIIIHEANLSGMNSSQVEALLGWLASGKNLIWTGAGGHQWINTALFRRVFPMEIRQKRVISINEADAQGIFAGVTQLEVWDIRDAEQAVILDAAGIPLVVQNQVGMGLVYFLAFDPISPALRLWEGREWLIQELLQDSEWDLLGSQLLSQLAGNMLSSVQNQAPNKIFVMLVSLLTTMVVLLVYRFSTRGQTRVWLLMLAMSTGSLLMGAALYTYIGRDLKIQNRLVTNVAFIFKHPQASRGVVEGYITYIATEPLNPAFVINRGKGSIASLSPVADSQFIPTHTQILPGQINLTVDPPNNWAPVGFRSYYHADIPIHTSITMLEDLLRISIDNQSNFMIEQSYLYYQDRWFSLGQVSADQDQLFMLSLSIRSETDIEKLFGALGRTIPGRQFSAQERRIRLERSIISTLTQIYRGELEAASSTGNAFIISILRGSGLAEAPRLAVVGNESFFGFLLSPISLK